MKKLIVLLFSLIFASSASATIYRWVDEKGVVGYWFKRVCRMILELTGGEGQCR